MKPTFPPALPRRQAGGEAGPEQIKDLPLPVGRHQKG